MKNHKRILSVKIKRMIEDSPDTSYLGEYSNRPKSDFAIDRAHAEDCASVEANYRQTVDKLERILQPIFVWRKELGNSADSTEWESLDNAADTLASLQDEAMECDCGERGDMQRNEYRYFNGSAEDRYKGESPEDIRKYVREDYQRMERLNRGDWCYIGIRAEAEIVIGHNAGSVLMTQTITSGGIWGTESDSQESYLKELEQEELSDLKTQLRAIGFSTRQISQAFKSIEEVTE